MELELIWVAAAAAEEGDLGSGLWRRGREETEERERRVRKRKREGTPLEGESMALTEENLEMGMGMEMEMEMEMEMGEYYGGRGKASVSVREGGFGVVGTERE